MSGQCVKVGPTPETARYLTLGVPGPLRGSSPASRSRGDHSLVHSCRCVCAGPESIIRLRCRRAADLQAIGRRATRAALRHDVRPVYVCEGLPGAGLLVSPGSPGYQGVSAIATAGRVASASMTERCVEAYYLQRTRFDRRWQRRDYRARLARGFRRGGPEYWAAFRATADKLISATGTKIPAKECIAHDDV
jgi:hypothetical protein